MQEEALECLGLVQGMGCCRISPAKEQVLENKSGQRSLY